MSFSNGSAITASALPLEKLFDTLDKVAIRVLFLPFLSSIINFSVELKLVRVSEFAKKNVSESRLFRLVVEAGDNRFPVVDEGAQIIHD